jgi:gag-polyprotein putative aspartyl protease
LATERQGQARGFVRNLAMGSVFRGLMFLTLLLTPLQGLAQPRVVALPFRYVDSFILVDAKIDGTTVRLLVDTGANKTILNAKSFGRVEMHVSKPVNRGAGIVGNALRLRVDLELAHQFMFSQHVSVMDLEELSRRFGIQFDGLLGQDILNQFHSVRIDYKNHVIELER